MDRIITIELNGREFALNFSVQVMFDMTDKYGSAQAVYDKMTEDNPEAFETTKWMFIRMANDGELVRRAEGYDHRPMLEDKDITIRMAPIEYMQMKAAVIEAVNAGYESESHRTTDEVDEGLRELEQKKTNTETTEPG